MINHYEITYSTQNTYENWVNDAYWQFLIIPMENDTQRNINVEFSNSLYALNEFSINGFGFNVIRVHPKTKFKEINFEATFNFEKETIDPFNFSMDFDSDLNYQKIKALDFRIDFEAFLKSTSLTLLPINSESIFEFDTSKTIFQNLQNLNSWVFDHLKFKAGVTQVDTTLNEVLKTKEGVCQDYTHLFCAVARKNGVPARYVSGYLNQDQGFVGDSQMHAWVEVYIPEIGWKGFDPTNNILANVNHIKVCHGKDYKDCSPLKGVIYALGNNQTKYAVTVQSQQ